MARARRRRARAVAAGGALVALLVLTSPAADAGVDGPDQALVRQACDYAWVAAVCDPVGYGDPQYLTATDPSPGAPFEQLVGVVHEHSGYSDGWPGTRPADYWASARTGHNVADAGGDTGVIVDFLYSSEHSENEKLPITTSAECIDIVDLASLLAPIACSQIDHPDHYRKWAETLGQAVDATDFDPATGTYTGFTAIRGFEYTNDVWNHLGVYFSRNVVNAKIDGAYLDPSIFYEWLREPVETGGGADALVVFNHPGGQPALTPFDDGFPHNQLLAVLLGGGNWNQYAYVPDVDDQVAGMEVNGGDDLGWYLRALTNGWHLGPLANEDEHQLEWSTSADGKTLLLLHGRSPADHYFALQHHRSVAIDGSLVDGSPGTHAVVPEIVYWADGSSVDDPASTVLGGVVATPGDHTLRFSAVGLPPGSPVVLLGSALATLPARQPQALGTVDGAGAFDIAVAASSPPTGEDWWFVVVCPPGTADCGVGEEYSAVTAPIWLASGVAAAPGGAGATTTTVVAAAGDSTSRSSGSGSLPTTGWAPSWWPPGLVALAVLIGRGRRLTR